MTSKLPIRSETSASSRICIDHVLGELGTVEERCRFICLKAESRLQELIGQYADSKQSTKAIVPDRKLLRLLENIEAPKNYAFDKSLAIDDAREALFSELGKYIHEAFIDRDRSRREVIFATYDYEPQSRQAWQLEATIIRAIDAYFQSNEAVPTQAQLSHFVRSFPVSNPVFVQFERSESGQVVRMNASRSWSSGNTTLQANERNVRSALRKLGIAHLLPSGLKAEWPKVWQKG